MSFVKTHGYYLRVTRSDPPGPPPLSAEDEQAIKAYDPGKYPPVAMTVDIVILTIRAGKLSVVLIRRGGSPYKGAWALPGGFVRDGEDIDAAAERELKEETGVVLRVSRSSETPDRADEPGHLEQLGTYGAPDRDPRMRVFSVAYLALVGSAPNLQAGDDADDARVRPVAALWEGRPLLAFDHARIIHDAVERARAKLEYTSLATTLLAEPFTMGDLRRVYEAVWGESLHPANFRRKVLATPGFVVPTGGRINTGRGWAEQYRRGETTMLYPQLRRPSSDAAASAQRVSDEAAEPDTL
jgi:8-oxo-dGTP diphosphatase